jgi:LacI family transcriptional regulator, galactose operon repressor
MGHPYRIREIAQQAGLSEATVDRVLNDRAGVRASTAAEVRQAIADLDRQRDQVRLAGQTFLVDLVMQAPQRFSSAVRNALEAELPGLRPALVRARFHLREEGEPDQIVAVLDRLARSRSRGVLLKAPDHPTVVAAVSRLANAKVPVVTLVTDLPGSRRIGYVGMDNRAAGATAAYLIARMGGAGSVLLSISRSSFRGEEEREAGFRSTLQQLVPDRPIVEVTDTDGLDASTFAATVAVLEADRSVDQVYSIGGGNLAILDAFRKVGRTPVAFIAHDLDGENTKLLRRRQLTAVLHHDLQADMRAACRLILAAHGALPRPAWSTGSTIHVVTPFNEPAR